MVLLVVAHGMVCKGNMQLLCPFCLAFDSAADGDAKTGDRARRRGWPGKAPGQTRRYPKTVPLGREKRGGKNFRLSGRKYTPGSGVRQRVIFLTDSRFAPLGAC